jgi:hypothetical protein
VRAEVKTTKISHQEKYGDLFSPLQPARRLRARCAADGQRMRSGCAADAQRMRSASYGLKEKERSMYYVF